MLLIPYQLKTVYFKRVQATLTLLVGLIAVFALQHLRIIDVHRWGLLSDRGQPERLLTHAFLHGGIWHLVLNLAGLAVFAQIVNASAGNRLFLLSALVCTLTSAFGEVLFDDRIRTLPAVGASGMAAGLLVIAAIWAPRIKVTFLFWYIFMIGFVDFTVWSFAASWVLTDTVTVLATDWRKEMIALWGHLGGFAGGFACWLIMRAFRITRHTGFVARSMILKKGSVYLRRIRGASVPAAADDPSAQLVAYCLRCGYRFNLKEPVGVKGLRCLHCGHASREVNVADPGLKRRRLWCGVALGTLSVVLFGAGWARMAGIASVAHSAEENPSGRQDGFEKTFNEEYAPFRDQLVAAHRKAEQATDEYAVFVCFTDRNYRDPGSSGKTHIKFLILLRPPYFDLDDYELTSIDPDDPDLETGLGGEPLWLDKNGRIHLDYENEPTGCFLLVPCEVESGVRRVSFGYGGDPMIEVDLR